MRKYQVFFLSAMSFGVAANGMSNDLGKQGNGKGTLSNNVTARSGWEITSGKDSQKATLKLSPEFGSHGVSVKVSIPLDKEDERTLIYNSTDAFVGASSIALSYRYTNAEMSSKQSDIHALCTDKPYYFNLDEFKGEFDSIKEEIYANNLIKIIISSLDPESSQAKALSDAIKTKHDYKTICRKYTGNELISAFDKDRAGADGAINIVQNTLKLKDEPFWIYGGTVEYGRQDYTWFDPQTEILTATPDSYNPLLTAKTDEEPMSIEGSLSWVKPGKLQITGSIEFERAYEAINDNKKQTRCAQNSSELFDECVSALQSMPEKTYNRNISLNVIWPFSLSFVGIDHEVALSPTFTFDATESDRSWKVPLFIFGDKKSVLNAGITYEYDSSDNGDEFFGIFLGGSL